MKIALYIALGIGTGNAAMILASSCEVAAHTIGKGKV